MDTKSVKGKICFEKGVEDDVYKYEIDKVWVQFRGLPKEFREFPIIWAIGSILGVPRAVDTKFTKKFGRARMKVAVLDPSLILNLVDVVIGDFVYELQFRVDQDVPNGEPEVIDMDSTMEDENPNEEKPSEEKHAEVKEKENMEVDGNNGRDFLWHCMAPRGAQADGSPIQRWQAKIRRLRQYLKGWAKNVSGAYKKEKTTIVNKLDELDKKAETSVLTNSELDLKYVLNNRVAELLREEELKWYQRAKVKHLLEGDANTKYYHLLANGRH
uniref:DUF4283 domain-containing protein n=1 Tax=Sorghum bicolor TaxID=4558 RepID=C6JRS1_SORBI